MEFKRTCIFGYKATWKRSNGSIVAENCLQSEPSWMYDHRDVIKVLKIKDVVLPGSHDSGSYTKSGDLYSIFAGSVFTQEENFLSQLIWGVRFFDIRPAILRTSVPIIDQNAPKFWISHSVFPTHWMQTVVDDTKTFLKNTKEIIIWEIINFSVIPGGGRWLSEDFKMFMEYLKQEFNDWLVKPGSLSWDKVK